MSLRIHNNLSKQLEVFQPLVAGQVRMYVCGMTVYDLCHIGHARSMITFDVVQRWLKASGYHVTYVRNITDIDDKIIRRATEKGESIRSLTRRMIDAMYEDADRLGIERPTHDPRATDHVPGMLALIQGLEARGFAYRSDNGDVNYAVRKFPGYGKLSGKSLDELRAGERVAVLDGKHDPLDFVLWKAAKDTEPDDAKWDSPFGAGRPGWHIECSAMSCALLGEQFDIHGGGMDLQFPHHENEIAQTEAVTGKPMASVWMHNGFVRVDDEKMSKSLGNFFTIREVLDRYEPEVLRFFIVRAHYRSGLNYSDTHLDDARQGLRRLYTALLEVPCPAVDTPVDWTQAHAMRFKAAMDEDFNTPQAVAVLYELASEVNRTKSPALSQQLKGLGSLLGLLQQAPEAFFKGGAASSGDEARINAIVQERAEAKRAKDFARADTLRRQLEAEGITLLDTPQGTTWRRA
jgi:cysteinyl-tRNA synthetase